MRASDLSEVERLNLENAKLRDKLSDLERHCAEARAEVGHLKEHISECHELQNNVAYVLGVDTDWDDAGRKAVVDAACRLSGNLDDARDEVGRLREEMGDLRYNLALRAYCAPNTDFDTMLSSLDSRISDALHGSVPATPIEPQEDWEPKLYERVTGWWQPPGSDGEQIVGQYIGTDDGRPVISVRSRGVGRICQPGSLRPASSDTTEGD